MSTSNIDPTLLGQIDIQKKLDSQPTRPRNELGQTEFFELMIAQLQNQDPLSPQDANQFLAQIAQFSQVNSTNEMQKSMDRLAESFQSSQALQASSLVGREVLVPGSSAPLADAGDVSGVIEVPQATGAMTLNVYDGSGQIVRQLDLGAQPAGDVRFSWDGLKNDGTRAAPGHYAFGASMTIDDVEVAGNINMHRQVESVTLGQLGGEMQLNLAGGEVITLGQIREIL